MKNYEQKKVREIFGADFKRLLQIAKNLHNIDERECSVPMTERQIKIAATNEAKFEAEAESIMSHHGYTAFHQTDCRGVSLYAIPKNAGKDEYIRCNYNRIGLAIY